MTSRLPRGTRSAPPPPHLDLPLSIEELALLPACGVPAYRAVRTFAFAFSDTVDSRGGTTKGVMRDALDGTRRRRVLVIRGHDGAGAMAAQMLVRRGWRVSVHVPFTCLHHEADGLEDGDEYRDVEEKENALGDREREGKERYYMRKVEERVRAWGGEEVIFDDGNDGEGDGERDALVRIINQLREDGDAFDAVLDTVGGKEVWEAAEQLLKMVPTPGPDAGTVLAASSGKKLKRIGVGVKQFTTLVGDFPGRTIPSAGDNFKAGLRSLNFGSRSDGKKLEGKVGYAWVSHAQDVDWEGEDIRDTLQKVLRTVAEDGIRPWVGEGRRTKLTSRDRVIPFEKAHEAFVSGDKSTLTDGGTVVVKVVG
ncbi:hypothetical protein H0H87_005277 [Tephrocybe sp. NHM501043]|nr:hypothetical protein H0H87_005277 [Tephrocybe sp. NHM501043]